MILINKNSSNKVVFTLRENQTSTSNDFLFRFYHDISNEEKIFYAHDISKSKERYNEFIVTDNTIEIPLSGQMNFKDGYHKYEIHEVPAQSPPTLDVDDSIKILETGKVFVVGAEENKIEFSDNDTETNTIFDE